MEMIWCQNCMTVIWAYDHQRAADLRGIANMWQLACPKCNHKGNFDGWTPPNSSSDDIYKAISKMLPEEPIYDPWSLMKAVAKIHKVAWEPSGDNTWTRKEED